MPGFKNTITVEPTTKEHWSRICEWLYLHYTKAGLTVTICQPARCYASLRIDGVIARGKIGRLYI